MGVKPSAKPNSTSSAKPVQPPDLRPSTSSSTMPVSSLNCHRNWISKEYYTIFFSLLVYHNIANLSLIIVYYFVISHFQSPGTLRVESSIHSASGDPKACVVILTAKGLPLPAIRRVCLLWTCTCTKTCENHSNGPTKSCCIDANQPDTG